MAPHFDARTHLPSTFSRSDVIACARILSPRKTAVWLSADMMVVACLVAARARVISGVSVEGIQSAVRQSSNSYSQRGRRRNTDAMKRTPSIRHHSMPRPKYRIDQQASIVPARSRYAYTPCTTSSTMYRRLAKRYRPPQYFLHRRHLAARAVLPTESATFSWPSRPRDRRASVQRVSSTCTSQRRCG